MLSINSANLHTWQVVRVYAYQLRPTDFVPCFGKFVPIVRITGVCLPCTPLGVLIHTQFGDVVANFDVKLKVLRYYGE